MTDDGKQTNHAQNGELPTISETSESNSTIAALVSDTPLINSSAAHIPNNHFPQRNRRRSSVSILHTIAQAQTLRIKDVRKRNFLVGSGRHLAEDPTHNLSECFPNGRLLTVMVATWNTGEQSKLYDQNFTPTARDMAKEKEMLLNDMSDILLPTFIEYVSDVIIICTQEMSATKNNTDWEILLQEVIGPAHVLYHSLHFGTLSLCIFLRRDLIWYITEPEEDVIKFRAVNALRTKASLVATFNLFGTSFMIINSHFEAGENTEDQSKRRLNFQNTVTKLSIPSDFLKRRGQSNESLTSLSDDEGTLKRPDSTTSLDTALLSADLDVTTSCDCVIWAGDMNFRVDMSNKEVIKLCEQQKYDEILSHDEFRKFQIKSGDRYSMFREAEIKFAPTYKYDLHHEDDRYAKNRTPSYTDRILYRDKPSAKIECTEYKSITSVKHSDHKPVVAHFRLKLKPGLNRGNLSYGKFNHEVYKRGCEQREQHHSLGVGVGTDIKRRAPITKSVLCVLQ